MKEKYLSKCTLMGTITHKEDRVTLEALLRDGILQSACANPHTCGACLN